MSVHRPPLTIHRNFQILQETPQPTQGFQRLLFLVDFFFFVLEVALGPGKCVALFLHEMEDDFELPDILGRETAFALAGLVRAEELELLLPVAHEAGGDAKELGHFGDGVIPFGE